MVMLDSPFNYHRQEANVDQTARFSPARLPSFLSPRKIPVYTKRYAALAVRARKFLEVNYLV